MPDYRSSSPLSFSTLPQFPLLIPAPRNSPFSSLQARLSPSTAALRDHTGSPLCWRGDNEYVGDCDDALDHVRAAYMSGGGRPAQRKAAVDFSAAAAASAYDYDLVVIGGGSGGLAAAKSAAELGANVLLADYVKPSPHGAQWGLGGTCVNVGCIPKKLMHTASLLGEGVLHDAQSFGWTAAAAGEGKSDAAAKSSRHSWDAMVASVQDHIRSLNFGYTKDLRDKRVTYENALATFAGPNTVNLANPATGVSRDVSARRVLIAVGGRPTLLDCPGGDLAITSDDVFSLEQSPGKTLVVGASYIALECAGFLAGLGLDVTVMVRSILLRGFDRDIADKIGEDMEQNHGVKFLRECVVANMEKTAGGKIGVSWKPTKSGGSAGGSSGEAEFDTVLAAIGRRADTAKLGLDKAGVQSSSRNGKIPCTDEQTNVPHIYAIGDVVVGVPELTPVAIQSGRLLANRLYGKTAAAMDYGLVATTVFTPTEYGTIGMSEEEALEKLGEDRVEVYHQSFTPLEWSLTRERPENSCYTKLVVDTEDSERVIGLHFLGPHAGEVVQGFAVAMRCGATYSDFHDTVGIHPTCSERICDLRVTKSSGASADSSGC
jgi:thioredoxin reductase (NADPH)